jgi:hypothetical protein
MIALLPALAVALLAVVVILAPLPTWAIVCLAVAGILIFISSETGNVTRFRNRGGV